jgi:hypothetical protein
MTGPGGYVAAAVCLCSDCHLFSALDGMAGYCTRTVTVERR